MRKRNDQSESGNGEVRASAATCVRPNASVSIVDEAIRFFAEHGFGGQTRELAKRMGITHSAIYRHFPSKEALIERVYEEIYLSRWSPTGATMIRDRTSAASRRG